MQSKLVENIKSNKTEQSKDLLQHSNNFITDCLFSGSAYLICQHSKQKSKIQSKRGKKLEKMISNKSKPIYIRALYLILLDEIMQKIQLKKIKRMSSGSGECQEDDEVDEWEQYERYLADGTGIIIPSDLKQMYEEEERIEFLDDLHLKFERDCQITNVFTNIDSTIIIIQTVFNVGRKNCTTVLSSYINQLLTQKLEYQQCIYLQNLNTKTEMIVLSRKGLQYYRLNKNNNQWECLYYIKKDFEPFEIDKGIEIIDDNYAFIKDKCWKNLTENGFIELEIQRNYLRDSQCSLQNYMNTQTQKLHNQFSQKWKWICSLTFCIPQMTIQTKSDYNNDQDNYFQQDLIHWNCWQKKMISKQYLGKFNTFHAQYNPKLRLLFISFIDKIQSSLQVKVIEKTKESNLIIRQEFEIEIDENGYSNFSISNNGEVLNLFDQYGIISYRKL